METNPFLENEEEKEEPYVVRKPFQKKKLTEGQRERNIKGIKMVQEKLKKIIPLRYIKGGNHGEIRS